MDNYKINENEGRELSWDESDALGQDYWSGGGFIDSISFLDDMAEIETFKAKLIRLYRYVKWKKTLLRLG